MIGDDYGASSTHYLRDERTSPHALSLTRRQIVGAFTNSTGTHGFLDTGGTFTRIDVPGATDTNAYGINDNGEIVGLTGPFPDIEGSHGFIATPVPEPSSVALIGVGVIGLAILRRQQGTRKR